MGVETMVSYLRDKINQQGSRKKGQGAMPLAGDGRGRGGPSWGTGATPLLRAAAPGSMRLSRIPRIRETARTAAKEKITLAMPTPGKPAKPPSRGRWIRKAALDRTKPEGVHLSAWSTVPLFIGGGAASSFSLPRKKQRGPKGVAKFYPGVATPSGLPPPLQSCLHLELSSFA